MTRSRAAGRTMVLVMAAAVAALAVPRPAAACDCAGAEAAIQAAAAVPGEMVAFVGVAGVPTTQPVTPITVTAWFGGPPPAPVVGIDVDGSAESSCGTVTPTEGAYLFVTHRQPDGLLGLTSCSVAQRLDTEEGQRLLALTRETLGDPVPVAAPATAPPGVGGLVETASDVLAPLAIVLAFGIGLLGVLVGVLRRREG